MKYPILDEMRENVKVKTKKKQNKRKSEITSIDRIAIIKENLKQNILIKVQHIRRYSKGIKFFSHKNIFHAVPWKFSRKIKKETTNIKRKFQRLNKFSSNILRYKGCPPRGVMVKAMNCGIVVREFVHQSRYYVHFRANTLGKGMNPLILPPAMGK